MVRVGPAGWDYPDWYGTVYPKPKPKGFDALKYVSGYFNTIEINSTFYRPPSAEVAQKWVERVSANRAFRFTAKLWRRFTHERAEAFSADDVRAARDALDVLFDAGRLGAVLLQFPWSFRRSDDNTEWLSDVVNQFAHLPLVLEVRHESWNDSEVRDWLVERNVGLVNIDQPLFSKSIKPSAHAISPVGYVRLHGRNYQQWFRKSAGRDERYDYLYKRQELEPWVERIKAISAQSKDVYAVTNNHRLGKAATNAQMMESMLTGKIVDAPPDLFRNYESDLADFARPKVLSP